MVRQTHRRLAVLAAIGIVASCGAAAARGTGVTPVASAAAVLPHAKAPRIPPCPFPRALRPAFEAASRDASIPPAMLYAVARVESNLRNDAESSAGARGILQVMPATARSLDLNPDELGSNVLAGARYLRQLLDRFGSSDLALAAYNAGPTAVTLAGGAPSSEVQTYVANVNLIWHSVAGCR
jgi:peptidoglycan DL-endopeptidase CwlO